MQLLLCTTANTGLFKYSLVKILSKMAYSRINSCIVASKIKNSNGKLSHDKNIAGQSMNLE